jgi:hypothetical protein
MNKSFGIKDLTCRETAPVQGLKKHHINSVQLSYSTQGDHGASQVALGGTDPGSPKLLATCLEPRKARQGRDRLSLE